MSIQERKEYESKSNPERSQSLPIVLFDIDWTLMRGFAILSFARYLTQRGLFDNHFLNLMQQDYQLYGQTDKGQEAYSRFATDLVNHYAGGIQGQQVGLINEYAEYFIDEVFAGNIQDYSPFSYTRNLVRTMKAVGKTIAISGSPKEALDPLARKLGIDVLRATTVRIQDGIFTGEVEANLALDFVKNKVFEELVDESVDVPRSFAFGDSPSDIPLLKAVGNGFILGSNPAMKQIGEKLGLSIVVESEVLDRVQERIGLVLAY